MTALKKTPHPHPQKKSLQGFFCWNTDSKVLNCLLHGNIVKHDIFIVWKITYHNTGFKNDKYLHLYSLGKGAMGNRTFQNVSREKGHFILWETGHSTLWERFFPLGIGPLILWESDHLSSGIRDIHWETGHRKWDTLSSGIRTTYPLGNILWDFGNRF